MKSGVSFPVQTGLSFSLSGGSAVTGYPVQNLADLFSIRTIFKAAAGGVTIAYSLPAAAAVSFLGIAHHNAEAGATYRHQIGGFDSGTLAFPARGLFQPCTPTVFTPVTASSGTLTLSSHSTGWRIGGLVVGTFFDWSGVSVPREIGLKPNDVIIQTIDGADHGMTQFKPRLFSGQRETLDADTEELELLRFQRRMGISKPFMWVWDADDNTTWDRECALVRNDALPSFRRREYPAGDFSFRFIEHLR